MSAVRLYSEGWDDYELIDAGGGKKLERWGNTITIRPEVQAYFKSGKNFSEWKNSAHWEFIQKGGQKGVWKQLNPNAKREWTIKYERLEFHLKLTSFKHVGLFPEQRINWDFIRQNIDHGDRFLNLFAYTGAASCVARAKGAETFHVDSVKQLISWAKQNMELSRLMNIKWVHDDALKFSSREVKRGNQYKGVIMDPPAWGLGVKKEKWKLEEKLDELLSNAAALTRKDDFLILNTYSPKVDLKFIRELATLYFPDRDVEANELWMRTTTEKEMYCGNLLRIL